MFVLYCGVVYVMCSVIFSFGVSVEGSGIKEKYSEVSRCKSIILYKKGEAADYYKSPSKYEVAEIIGGEGGGVDVAGRMLVK